MLIGAIACDILTLMAWDEYLSSGSVNDNKHSITFVGDDGLGYLIGLSLVSVLFTYYAINQYMHNK